MASGTSNLRKRPRPAPLKKNTPLCDGCKTQRGFEDLDSESGSLVLDECKGCGTPILWRGDLKGERPHTKNDLSATYVRYTEEGQTMIVMLGASAWIVELDQVLALVAQLDLAAQRGADAVNLELIAKQLEKSSGFRTATNVFVNFCLDAGLLISVDGSNFRIVLGPKGFKEAAAAAIETLPVRGEVLQ